MDAKSTRAKDRTTQATFTIEFSKHIVIILIESMKVQDLTLNPSTKDQGYTLRVSRIIILLTFHTLFASDFKLGFLFGGLSSALKIEKRLDLRQAVVHTIPVICCIFWLSMSFYNLRFPAYLLLHT